MDPAKNDTFLRSGRKIIILTQIIMLIWVSGYVYIVSYKIIWYDHDHDHDHDYDYDYDYDYDHGIISSSWGPQSS